MNLTHLTDEALIQATKAIVRKENQLLVELLHHLRETESRRLFSKLHYESLFEYCQVELRYSENATKSRTAAMRLMRDLPAIEIKIRNGDLNLTTMAYARRAFRTAKPTPEKKLEVLRELENKTTREVAQILNAHFPKFKIQKPKLDFASIEDEILRGKLLALKCRFGRDMSLSDLLYKMCDELEKKAPANAKEDSEAEILRQVWRRDQDKCTNCGTTHDVQADHIIPRAAGGPTTLGNMRLLCRNCNLRAAINFYGRKKMSSYLRAPEIPYAA